MASGKFLFREVDALAHDPSRVAGEGPAINYVQKGKKRVKGAEVVFDPKAHKWV